MKATDEKFGRHNFIQLAKEIANEGYIVHILSRNGDLLNKENAVCWFPEYDTFYLAIIEKGNFNYIGDVQFIKTNNGKK